MRDSIPSEMPMRALVRTPNTQKVITSRTFPCHKRRKKPMDLTPTSRTKRAIAAFRAAKVTIADTAVPGTASAFFRRLSDFGGLLFWCACAKRFIGSTASGKKKRQQNSRQQLRVNHLFPLLDFGPVEYKMRVRCLEHLLERYPRPTDSRLFYASTTSGVRLIKYPKGEYARRL